MNRQENIKLRLTVIKNWKARIAKTNISIVKLAKLAEVSRPTIYETLNKQRIPNVRTINKIEKVLDDLEAQQA